MTAFANLEASLNSLGGPNQELKRALLADLAELLDRQASQAKRGFSISDPLLASLPPTLPPKMIRVIAHRVGSILLNPVEVASIRATAAFVLGKTFDPVALATVARAVTSTDVEPGDLARQLGFAFDVLWEEYKPGNPPIDLDAMARGFKALGVPWDDVEGRVKADEI